MTRDKFFKLVDKKIGLEDRELIEWSYALAKQFHREQVRDQGTRYFEHCRDVAVLLLKYGPSNPDEIIVGFLHDIYEDQFVPRGMIRRLFGQEVNEALKILSHEKPFYKSHGKIVKTSEKSKEYYGVIKKSSAMIKRVKLADRLHNLKTLSYCSKEKQIRKIEETIAYILPIAKETDVRFHKDLVRICRSYKKRYGLRFDIDQ